MLGVAAMVNPFLSSPLACIPCDWKFSQCQFSYFIFILAWAFQVGHYVEVAM